MSGRIEPNCKAAPRWPQVALALGSVAVIIAATGIFSVAFAGEGQVLPDPVRTPGFTNPDVTSDTMDSTICNPGWRTSSIRPSTNYTNKLKRKQIDEYGYDDKEMADYEEDHLIPLEVGGDPQEPKNLWPESYRTQPHAVQVCAGAIGLRAGQHKIATNWVAIHDEMNERMLHDSELRIALSIGSETSELNRIDKDHELSFNNETSEAGGADEDEEGSLDAAQWHWIAVHRRAPPRD